MFGQVFQHAQHALGAAFTDGFHIAAFLQQFTRHVQGQVSRINHAFDKAQVGGQQRFGVVHDEDALDVKLDARRLFAVVQILRRFGGDVQELGVLGAAFYPVVGVGQRGLKVVAELLVKLVVLLRRDVFFGARPDSVALVGGFPFAGFHHATGLTATGFVAWVDQLAVFPLFLFHQDGQADVVRVFANDAFEFPGAGVVQCVVAQVQRHAGAALGTVNGFDLKVARAAAGPAHAFSCFHARTA